MSVFDEMIMEQEEEREKQNILPYWRHRDALLEIGDEAVLERRERNWGKRIQFRRDLEHPEEESVIRISPQLSVIWEKIKREKSEAKCREIVEKLLEMPENEGGCQVISVKRLKECTEQAAEEEAGYENMWFATTAKGIDIRPGLLNEEDPVAMELGDNCVHALMAGRTGAGKSVALHAIITGLMFEYAPWELNINLADFKIVEMSKYGNSHYEEEGVKKTAKAPHVGKIAATDGMEYVLSLMYDMYEKMDIRQKVFASLGIQKLSQYRDMFKVVLPREILIVDEFQQMYELATPRQAEIINQLIKMITKLGRATGYHLFFTSQSMSGTVRADVLANFKLRLCLPASEDVSSLVLGNKAASELTGAKSRGYLIANSEGGAREFNQEFKVPLLTEGEENGEEKGLGDLEEVLRINSKLAQQIGYDKGMDFYREEALRPLWGNQDSLEADMARFYENTRPAVAGDDELEDYLLLGDSCVYARAPGKNSTLEYTPLKYGDRKNILCIADSVYQRTYMLELLTMQYRLRNESNQNYIVHGDLVVKGLLRTPGVSFKEIPAKNLNETLLQHYQFREILQQFVQLPAQEWTKDALHRIVEGRQKEKRMKLRQEQFQKLEAVLNEKKKQEPDPQIRKELERESAQKIQQMKMKTQEIVERELTQQTDILWAMYQKGLDDHGQFRFKRLKTITFWINGCHMLSDLMEEWAGRLEGYTMADVLKRCTNMGIRMVAVGAKASDLSPAVLKDFGYYFIQSSDEMNFTKLGMQRPKEYKDTVMRFRAVNEPLNRQKPSLYILSQDEKLVKTFEMEGAEQASREREFFAGIC